MDYTEITIPQIGEPTRRSLASNLISNTEYLNTRVGSGNMGVFNGGFEQDTNSDGIPDGWEFTAYAGGAVSLETTDQVEGLSSLKFVATDTNGGGECISEDFIPCSTGGKYNLKWWLKSSAVDVSNKVEALIYTGAKEYSETLDVWSEDTNSPTDWTLFARTFTIPDPGRFMKIKLTGGVEDTNDGGTVLFDAVDFFTPERVENIFIINENGDFQPDQNVVGAHIFGVFNPAEGNPQFFGTMNLTNYYYGYEFYEMNADSVISYELDNVSRVHMITYGAVR